LSVFAEDHIFSIPLVQNLVNSINCLFAQTVFEKQLTEAQKSLRRVVSIAVISGIPMPCHLAGISYLDGLRTAVLSANLLQAQRDYFGAHMSERIDQPRGDGFIPTGLVKEEKRPQQPIKISCENCTFPLPATDQLALPLNYRIS